MIRFNVDPYGLDVHCGRLAFYSSNQEENEPGSFSIHLPVPALGELVFGWEPICGIDFYRLTPQQTSLMAWLGKRGVDMDEWLDDPSEVDLLEAQTEMALDELSRDGW